MRNSSGTAEALEAVTLCLSCTESIMQRHLLAYDKRLCISPNVCRRALKWTVKRGAHVHQGTQHVTESHLLITLLIWLGLRQGVLLQLFSTELHQVLDVCVTGRGCLRWILDLNTIWMVLMCIVLKDTRCLN